MTSPIHPGDLLTAFQLAEALKMSETWVREKARDLKMPHYWIDGIYRFDLEEVREWLVTFHRGPKVQRVPKAGREKPSEEFVANTEGIS